METILRRNVYATLITVFAVVVWLLPLPGLTWDRSGVTVFATLPNGSTTPEGITADKDGNIYTSTFDMPRKGKPGQIIVFDPSGKLLRVLNIKEASNLLLDLAFHPMTGDLLVVDFGGNQVLKVDPQTGDSSVFMQIPRKTPEAKPAPNAPAFDKKGNVYVSDSFQGIIWRTGPNGGKPEEWLNHDLLRTQGVPRFGANGLGFNKAGDALFVGNTGNRQIIRIPVSNGAAGKPEVFVNSVGGPDGLFIDDEDRIWTAANQNNEVVVIDPSGRVIAKIGDFDGLDERGAVRGLLFPGALYRVGDYVYVANLAFDMRRLNAVQTIDAKWCEETKIYSIARVPVPKRFPHLK
jgi:sugar lactone lactonase YvrE